MLNQSRWKAALCGGVALLLGQSALADPAQDSAAEAAYMYDEASYTQYVETTMLKLDRLYLDFCGTCGVDAEKARAAKQEFLVTVRDLMQHMNGRFDKLEPKQGAALSPTETLVSIHAMTMLVDILAQTQLEEMAPHPYIE